MSEVKKLKYFVNGKWLTSKTSKYMDCYNPSTGEVIAQAPACTPDEVEQAIQAAKKAFVSWSRVPVFKRVQILFKLRNLIEQHLDELTIICATENGKVYAESEGDILKVREPVEFAAAMPNWMKGESLWDTSTGFDCVTYREPVGVFGAIAPFNFPGMIPMGWMAPLCIAAGNTMVLKAASMVPQTAMRLTELWQEAGLPDGVLNLVTCNRNEAEILLKHPDVCGITFVGSTSVGLHIYTTAAAHGKRVQALCEAKNHGLVLDDASLEASGRVIMNSSFGCAGERCMALPVVVAQESIADRLVEIMVGYAKELKVGPAVDKTSELGPVITDSHRQSVVKWIDKGIEEGAKVVLDGRKKVVKGYEKGFYLGPTILDHVKPGMTVGDEEIFGPVQCIKRVKDFEEGLTLMNKSRFANGAVIFTSSGYYAREFLRRTDGGMCGVNVGIPVPTAVFPFAGHKNSFFGDLHILGEDGIKFFTETKTITTKWFSVEQAKKAEKVYNFEAALGGQS
jgi:malonate-semialdehyde dehydrogenase (acetylating) / methylmalonate-semialdehyde dehydrogenase